MDTFTIYLVTFVSAAVALISAAASLWANIMVRSIVNDRRPRKKLRIRGDELEIFDRKEKRWMSVLLYDQKYGNDENVPSQEVAAGG